MAQGSDMAVKIIMGILAVIVVLLIVTHAAGFSTATGTVSQGAISETDVLAGLIPAGYSANTAGVTKTSVGPSNNK